LAIELERHWPIERATMETGGGSAEKLKKRSADYQGRVETENC